jgi:hypothetical protein
MVDSLPEYRLRDEDSLMITLSTPHLLPHCDQYTVAIFLLTSSQLQQTGTHSTHWLANIAIHSEDWQFLWEAGHRRWVTKKRQNHVVEAWCKSLVRGISSSSLFWQADGQGLPGILVMQRLPQRTAVNSGAFSHPHRRLVERCPRAGACCSKDWLCTHQEVLGKMAKVGSVWRALRCDYAAFISQAVCQARPVRIFSERTS